MILEDGRTGLVFLGGGGLRSLTRSFFQCLPEHQAVLPEDNSSPPHIAPPEKVVTSKMVVGCKSPAPPPPPAAYAKAYVFEEWGCT